MASAIPGGAMRVQEDCFVTEGMLAHQSALFDESGSQLYLDLKS